MTMNDSQENQNRALLLLAGAIQGVAHANGTHVGNLVGQVGNILNPPPEEIAPVGASPEDKAAYVAAGFNGEDYDEFKKNEAKAASISQPKAAHERA
jgi:hypothetical protein